ncbi:MAG: hypothetical protein JW940_14135 [Polyangiaceae bacterium]|nr:hypothetical protein [Polyangiaceae bacterium]
MANHDRLRTLPARALFAVIVSTLWAACASSTPKGADAQMLTDATDRGGTLQPGSDAERAVLKQLDALAPDQPRTAGTTTIVAGPEYAAASGRRCRTVHLTDSKRHASQTHLACRDRNGWFYVPDVLPVATAQ